jgi:hypothetical protein
MGLLFREILLVRRTWRAVAWGPGSAGLGHWFRILVRVPVVRAGDWQAMMAFYAGEIATTGTLGMLMAIIARAFRGKGRRRDKPAP